MRIALISDLHGNLPDTPECDLLLIAGDVTPVVDHSWLRQKLWIDTEFRYWLSKQPARKIIGIAGNHDFIAQSDDWLMRDLPWTYLQDEGATFEGLNIWGTPWTPTFGRWAFMDKDENLDAYFSQIPDNTDILLSHGPAYGYGDLTDRSNEHVGSVTLREAITRTNPRLHVYGHIHEAYGIEQHDTTVSTNVSYVDLNYHPRRYIPCIDYHHDGTLNYVVPPWERCV